MAGLMQLQQALADKKAKQAGGSKASALTPDEKKALDAGKDAVSRVLYENKEARAGVVKLISAPPFHAGVGDASAMLTRQADQMNNGELPEQIILPLGYEALGMVTDLGEELGLFKADQKFLARAAQAMVKRLFDDYGAPDQQTVKEQSEGIDSSDLSEGLSAMAEANSEGQ